MFITNVPSFYALFLPLSSSSCIMPSPLSCRLLLNLVQRYGFFLKPPNLVCRFGGVFSKIQKKQMLKKITRSKLDFD